MSLALEILTYLLEYPADEADTIDAAVRIPPPAFRQQRNERLDEDANAYFLALLSLPGVNGSPAEMP